jgi:hypothetical protein
MIIAALSLWLNWPRTRDNIDDNFQPSINSNATFAPGDGENLPTRSNDNFQPSANANATFAPDDGGNLPTHSTNDSTNSITQPNISNGGGH